MSIGKTEAGLDILRDNLQRKEPVEKDNDPLLTSHELYLFQLRLATGFYAAA